MYLRQHFYDRLGQKGGDPVHRLRPREVPIQVLRIQTDNGSEFQAQFHWHVLDRGIEHVYTEPATPRLNGKVERSPRIDAEEVLPAAYALSRAWKLTA